MSLRRRIVPDPEFVEVAPGVFAYVQIDGSWMLNNTGLIANPDGSNLMVDTTSTEKRNRALLAVISGRTGDVQPTALINTHHHGDHTFGNWLLPASTPIVGHILCREDTIAAGLIAAQAFPGPDYGRIEIRPADVLFNDQLTMYLGDREIQLIHVGPAHTRSDVLVWLPELKVLFSGDIVFNGGQPFLLEGSLAGYPKALEAIRGLEPEIVVPGHGPVCRGEEIPQVLDALKGYAAWVGELARDGHAAGKTPLEVALNTDQGEYARWQEGERLVGNLHRAYSELDGNPLGTKIPIPRVREEMVTLNGGPIECLA